MNKPDLSWMQNLGVDRVVISFHYSLNLGPARGVLFKLIFGDRHSELLMIPPGLFSPILRGCRRFLLDFKAKPGQQQTAIDMFKEYEPTVTQSDFDLATVDNVAVQSGFLATANALGILFWNRQVKQIPTLMDPPIVRKFVRALEALYDDNIPVKGIDIPN